MSRTAWFLVSLTVIGALSIPALAERLRAARRAVGAFAVYWVSLNLWGTGLHLGGLSSNPPRGVEIAWVALPPFLVVAAWLAWDARSQRRA